MPVDTDLSIANLILGASLLVQALMLVLIAASVMSWALIMRKRREMRDAKREADRFEETFWSTEDLTTLFNRINSSNKPSEGMERMFLAGFKEFARLRKRESIEPTSILEGAQRAMRISLNRQVAEFEVSLPFLATVGSVSPYVGLFGTVWGIMEAFQALGNVHQATLAMVAPGISQALIATALGLFAAIPAVVAYNRFSSEIDRLFSRYDIFQEEFASILQRQVHS
jgi:biopolymer transport protein TolQ